MGIKVRRAVLSDTDRLIELLYQVEAVHQVGRPDLFREHGAKFTVPELHGIIEDDLTPVFVAESDGRVVGYIFGIISEFRGNTIFFDMKNLHLEDVCVDEACRGKGVGAVLMEYITAWAKENGITHMDLDVWEFNDGARRFYEKYGFSTQKRRMDRWV